MFCFSFQAIKEALDTIQPSVESADREKDKVLSNANNEEQTKIKKLIEKLNQEWKAVNKEYSERQVWVLFSDISSLMISRAILINPMTYG